MADKVFTKDDARRLGAALTDCYVTQVYGLRDQNCRSLIENGTVKDLEELNFWRDKFDISSPEESLFNSADRKLIAATKNWSKDIMSAFVSSTVRHGNDSTYRARQDTIINAALKTDYSENLRLDVLNELSLSGESGWRDDIIRLSANLGSPSQKIRIATIRAMGCLSSGMMWADTNSENKDFASHAVFKNYAILSNYNSLSAKADETKAFKSEIAAFIKMVEDVSFAGANPAVACKEKYKLLTYLFAHPNAEVQDAAVDYAMTSKDPQIRQIMLYVATNPTILNFDAYGDDHDKNYAAAVMRRQKGILKEIRADIDNWMPDLKTVPYPESDYGDDSKNGKGDKRYATIVRARTVFRGLTDASLFRLARTIRDPDFAYDLDLIILGRLGDTTNKTALNKLSALVDSDEPGAERLLLRLLTRVGDKWIDIVPKADISKVIQKLLQSSDPTVRDGAAFLIWNSLDNLKAGVSLTPHQLGIIATILGSNDKGASSAAFNILLHYGYASVTALRAAAYFGSDNMGILATALLGNILRDKSLSDLETIYKIQGPKVQEEALKNIWSYFPGEVSEKYRLLALENPNNNVKKAAIENASTLRRSSYEPSDDIVRSAVKLIGDGSSGADVVAGALNLADMYPTNFLPHMAEECRNNNIPVCRDIDSVLDSMGPLERLYYAHGLIVTGGSVYLKSIGYKAIVDAVYDLIN